MITADFTRGIDDIMSPDVLYQWDHGVKLSVTGLDNVNTTAVHFTNTKRDYATVVTGVNDNGVLIVDIPNDLLEEQFDVIAYIHITNGAEAKTIKRVRIQLNKRVKPSDYEFVENVDIKSFERLEGMFNNFTTDVNTDYDTFKSSVNGVMSDYKKTVDNTISQFMNDVNATVSMLNAYPVGSIYMSVNATSPASLFGGTWERLKDRFLLASGDTYNAGGTGGEATHTLTSSEIPKHDHSLWINSKVGNLLPGGDITIKPWTAYISSATGWSYTDNNSLSGGRATLAGRTNEQSLGNGSHNNMPPYLSVYMWKRTA